jgi:predicted GIY-YIG superfamily endonuclease/plasmid stability protein
MHYTYIHRRESDNAVFYVGKGLVKARRAFSAHGRNKHWKHTVAKHGLKVEIVAEWATNEEACEHEKLLISCFKDMGHTLVNLTDGGEGVLGRVVTEEHRRNISKGRTGVKLGEAARANIKASKQFVSQETRAKISAAQKGKTLSDEHRTKISAGLKANSVQISKNSTNISPETRAKMRAAKVGRTLTEDHKRKIAENNPRMRPVLCSNGMYFSSIAKACEWLRVNGKPKACGPNLQRALKSPKNMALGFHWQYATTNESLEKEIA